MSVRFSNRDKSSPHLLPNCDFEGIEGFESHELSETLNPTVVYNDSSVDIMIGKSDSTSTSQAKDNGDEVTCKGNSEE